MDQQRLITINDVHLNVLSWSSKTSWSSSLHKYFHFNLYIINILLFVSIKIDHQSTALIVQVGNQILQPGTIQATQQILNIFYIISVHKSSTLIDILMALCAWRLSLVPRMTMSCLWCLRLEPLPSYQGLVQVGSLPDNVYLVGIEIGMGWRWERENLREFTQKKRGTLVPTLIIIQIVQMQKIFMMRSMISLVVMTLLYGGESLHLKGHYEVSHQSSQLSSIEEATMKHLSDFSQNSQQNNNKISQATTVQEKITLIQDYLQQQRGLLLRMIKQSTVDLNSTNYACPGLTEVDKGALNQFNQAVLADMQDLSKTTPSLGLDNDQNRVGNQIKELLQYVNTLNLPVYAKNIENISIVAYISNINSGSYILDGSKVLDSPQLSIEVCPFESPVAKSPDSCVACPSESPYFVVINSSCMTCDSYDETKRQCKKGDQFFNNLKAGKAQILLADSQKIQDYQTNPSNLPLCSTQTPFYSGKSCIACSNKLYFSLKDRSCQTCPSGKFYNIFTQKCLIQLYFSNLNNLQWETKNKQMDDILQSITIKRSNQSYTSCPINLPFSLEDKCIKCQIGTHFSYDTLSCIKCSNTTQLDLNMHKCLKPGNLNFQTNPLNGSNLIYNGRSQNEWMNTYYRNVQQYSGIADCPKELPNFDGLACISCPHSHPYFNLELMVCQTCQGTTLYDEQQHQCVTNNENRPVQTPSWEKMAAVVFSS